MTDRSPSPTMCLASDGTTRPMADVLRERAAQYAERPKAEREAAYRERCWQIACLQACTCSWPVVRAETTTGHEAWCTAHRWQINREAARSGEPHEHAAEARQESETSMSDNVITNPPAMEAERDHAPITCPTSGLACEVCDETADAPAITPAIASDLVAEGREASAEYLARVRAEQPDAVARLEADLAQARATIEMLKVAADQEADRVRGIEADRDHWRDLARQWRAEIDTTHEQIDRRLPAHPTEGANVLERIAHAGWMIGKLRADLTAKERRTDALEDVGAKSRSRISTLERATEQMTAEVTALEARVAEFGAAIGVSPGEPLDVLIRAAYEVIALQRRVAGLEEERDDANQRVAVKVAGQVRRKAGSPGRTRVTIARKPGRVAVQIKGPGGGSGGIGTRKGGR